MTLPPWIFPATMIALSLLAAVVYACHSDWRRMTYWLAAAILTTTVTF